MRRERRHAVRREAFGPCDRGEHGGTPADIGKLAAGERETERFRAAAASLTLERLEGRINGYPTK
jgi:hypothetical protein